MRHERRKFLEAVNAILRQHPATDAAAVRTVTKASRQTVTRHLNRLAKLGALVVTGTTSDREYAPAPGWENLSQAEFVARVHKLEKQHGKKKGAVAHPAGSSPVWGKALPTSSRGFIRFETRADALHVLFDADPKLAYEKIDPCLALDVLASDPHQLVGFATAPFERIFRRHGFGALAFQKKDLTVDEVLTLTLAGLVSVLKDTGELKTPAGRQRLHALYENVHVLSRQIGERELGYYDEGNRKLMIRTP